jgi:Tol biopolymer transport system component
MKTIAFFFIFACLFILIPATANEIVQFTEEAGYNGLPFWSPDEERIMYYALSGENNIWNTNIKIMGSDGKNQSRLHLESMFNSFFNLYHHGS